MNLSAKIIERLTLYHCILGDALETDEKFVSSARLAQLLKVDDSQVRKDISLCGVLGKAKIGYDVRELKTAIEKLLGFAKHKNLFIIGAGNLGFALSKYDDFSNYGMAVAALFDNDPLKVGISVNDKPIFHISQLPEKMRTEQAETVILTVPKNAAQEMADFAVSCGAKYIWNFTQKVLDVPDGVCVYYENLIGNFLQLTHHQD